MSKQRKVLIIVNPASGRSQRRSALDDLVRRIRDANHAITIHTTGGAGDARTASRDACGDNTDLIVVSGGDGTISEVIDGMIGDGIAILVVPGGTENIVARYLGLPSDPDSLWDVFENGSEVRLDIPRRNGRRFLLVAGVGSDGEVARRLAERRCGNITHLSYAIPIWQTLWGYRIAPLSVEADGRMIHEGPGWVLIGNIPRYALGLHILGKAKPDDGLLDVCVFPARGTVRLLKYAIKALFHRHLRDPSVIYTQARSVCIRSEVRVPVQVDGDFDGWLPVTFDLAPNQARFLVKTPVRMY